ncbi:MAG: ribonuclease P protein component [Mycobacteriales bacterium]
MLPAAARVRRSADFSAVLKSGRRAGRGPLVVHLLVPPAAGQISTGAQRRAGFVVGRGIGNAVARNRTRRRLRHLVRDRLDALPAGATLIVRALPGSGELSAADLAGHLDSGLRHLTRVSA